MNRFYRNLLIIIVIIGLIIFLFFRFIANYTSAMHRMYSPDEFEEHDEPEPDEDPDTNTYIPSNQH